MTDAQSWFQSLWAWVVQPWPEYVEFILRAGIGLIVIGWIVFGILGALLKGAKPIPFYSNFKPFKSPNDEMAVRMTQKGLELKKLNNGQKVYLTVTQVGKSDLVRVPVTVKKRPPYGGQFGDSDLEVSISAISATGADAANHLSKVVLSPIPLGWENLMFQSFNHPDVNVRLAWLLSLWSFIVSTMAGVIISHFHMLIQK